MAAPEVHPGDLEKFACNPAEQPNQRGGVRSFSGFCRYPEQHLLKAFIGPAADTVFRGNDRAADRSSKPSTDSGGIVVLIHKCLNLLGNYIPSQIESRKMGDGVPLCEIPRLEMRFPSHPEKH